MTQRINQAAHAATQLLDAYYASRRETTPSKDAEPLVRQIRARRPWLRPDELTQEAAAIITRAKLDVDDLVENFLRIRVEIQDLRPFDTKAGASVFGFADTGLRRIAVCERVVEYQPLYRSTLSHETGHICLHGDRTPAEYPYAPEATRRPQVEREADDFMVALLLPWSIVELSVLTTALAWRIDIDEPFRDPDSCRGRWQWHERFLPDISSRFEVSKHMTLIRLLRRGVISRDTLEDHLRTGSRGVFPRAVSGPSRYRLDTSNYLSQLKTRMARSGSRKP